MAIEVYKITYEFGKPVHATILTVHEKKEINFDYKKNEWGGSNEEKSAIERFINSMKNKDN